MSNLTIIKFILTQTNLNMNKIDKKQKLWQNYNIMDKIKSSKLFNFGMFAISLVFAAIFTYLSKYCYIWGDDIGHSTYGVGEKLFDCLKYYSDGCEGLFIGHFFSKFFSFKLPLFLNQHPQDFIASGHSFIRGMLLALILLAICKFSQLYKKSNVLFMTTYVLSFLFFIYAVFNSYATVINSTYLFYRYCFPLLFFSIFIYHIFLNTLQNKKNIRIHELIIVSISALIIGTSSELMIILSIFICSLILFYNIFFNILYRIFPQKNIHKLHLFNLDYTFYVPFVCLLFFPIFFKTALRGINDPIKNISLASDLSLESLKEFIYFYFQILFQMEYIIWTFLISSFLLALYIALKKQETEKLLPQIFILTTILMIYFSLFLCGKNGTLLTVPECKFYISHCNIRFLYKMLLLFPFFINLGYIMQNLKNSILHILPVLIVCILTLGTVDYKLANSFLAQFVKITKKSNYISEKIVRFYKIKNPYQNNKSSK